MSKISKATPRRVQALRVKDFPFPVFPKRECYTGGQQILNLRTARRWLRENRFPPKNPVVVVD